MPDTVQPSPDDTLAEVWRLLKEQFYNSGVDITSVHKVHNDEARCAAAYGRRAQEFPFFINGRTPTEIATELKAQIVDWMS